MTLQNRAQQLHTAGRRTAYAIGYATVNDPACATDLLLCLGPQWSGAFLYMLDLDSHFKGQDADAAKDAFDAARPELTAKLDWYRSTSGTGWHALFESHKRLDTGKLYDQADNHIGELLGADTDRTLDPGDVRIPCLHIGEIERLFNVWHVNGSDPKGERWADRAKQGAEWTRGAQHIPVTKAQLRTFLQNDAGKVGKQLATYFDTPPPNTPPRNRSDAAGTLMQNLMYFARKLPGCANAPFHIICANVKAYWMASDSFGKAGEKGYSQDKDGDSLIAQIVHGDPYGDGRHWTCPSWVPGNTATATPAPAPEKAAPRPAHRPAGDRAKHLATFWRVIQAIVPDEFGRRTYTLDYLSEQMRKSKSPAAPRTCQSYLQTMRDRGVLLTAQINGNGKPFAIITRKGETDGPQKPDEARPCKHPDHHGRRGEEHGRSDAGRRNADRNTLERSTAVEALDTTAYPQHCNAVEARFGGETRDNGADRLGTGRNDGLMCHFGGADNSQKRGETIPESTTNGGADPSTDERFLMPQSAESPLQCKEDHQNPSAPAGEPGGASYVPGADWTNDHRHDGSFSLGKLRWIGSAAPRPPRQRRMGRQKGQASFLGRDGVAAKFTRKKRHGEAPAPTPYRPRAAPLPLESLPEPPPAAAPAGAQGAGVPLSGPQAGPTPAQRMAARQRRLEAEQVQR